MSEISLLQSTLKSHLPWHGARLNFLAQLLIALFRVKTVNLVEIASAFMGQAQQDSHYKWLQRFFRHFEVDATLVAKAVVALMDFPSQWVLCFDRTQWQFRLATSIQQGTVTASLILRKLSSYPRQNGLAVALRELGRIERTLFTLNWFQDIELRRRVNAGLNKGESRNALSRALFFNRLGEMRDRSFENQRYRASGLNLVTAAIILWNTVYLERSINALKDQGQPIDENLLQYLSPLGWEHINLIGDYIWRQRQKVGKGKFRSLRTVANP